MRHDAHLGRSGAARGRLQRLLPALLAAAGLGAPALADGLNPASLLVFPIFDHSQTRNTLITITNVNSSSSVRVHRVFVSPPTSSPTFCLEANFTKLLTPNDNWTFLSSVSGAHSDQGFVYAYAVNATGQPIGFNWLIGDDLVLDGLITVDYAVTPLAFLSRRGLNQPADVNADGDLDLDGIEYEQGPDNILIPRFMGQSASHQSELILLGLSGGQAFETIVDLIVFNDNEEALSGQYLFRCWTKVRLQDISGIFDNSFLHNSTNDATTEIVGATSYEAGWLFVDGNIAQSSQAVVPDPLVLAVLVENTLNGGAGAEIPFIQGRQPRGTIFPASASGNGP